MFKKAFETLKGVSGWAKSRHASSVVVGLALGLYGVGLYYGLPREVLITGAAGVVLVGVPVANMIAPKNGQD